MKNIIINGNSSKLEARYHATDKQAPVVVIFHGHPQNHGNMDHPVILLACKVFASLGCNVFSMNFRGVGRSSGEFSHGDQEVMDGAICLDWLRAKGHESKEFWVMGLSFGGWVALQLLMRRPDCSRFIVLSLPIGTYDLNFLAPCPRSGLVINGGNDPMILPEGVLRFRRHIMRHNTITVDFEQIPGADHSFKGNSPEENVLIKKTLEEKLLAYGHQHLFNEKVEDSEKFSKGLLKKAV